MTKKLTVVITVYNEEKYIAECIESVINQTYSDLEIILIDDGSKDNSFEICKAYEAKDHRVKAVRKENGGSVSARKEGIKYATSEYITYIDGDDWLELDHYEKIMSKIEDADILAYSLTCVYKENKTEIISNEAESGLYVGEKLDELRKSVLYSGDFGHFGLFPSMCSKVFKKSLIEENLLRVHDDIRMGDDGACTFPSICDAKKIIIDNDIAGYLYRKTETGTITSSFDFKEFYRIENLYNVLRNAFLVRKADYMNNQLLYYMAFLMRTLMVKQLSNLTFSNLVSKLNQVKEIYKLEWIQYVINNIDKEKIKNETNKETMILVSNKSPYSLFYNWYVKRKIFK